MSKRLRRKVAFMVVVEAVFLVLVCGLLMRLQTNLSVNDRRENIEGKLAEMNVLIANANMSAEDIIETFDEEHNGKAGSVAFMFQNGVLDGYTKANMQEMKTLLGVDNVLVVDREGKTLAQAQKSPADFSLSRYNQLRTVFETGEAPASFEVETDDTHYRYYSAKIDDETMIVVEKNVQELDSRLASTSTWESILSKVTVGLNGFSFAVSAKDYTMLYYPDNMLIGQDVLGLGITAENLEDDKFSWLTVNDERLYGGVTMVDDAYIFCVVTEQEILASQTATVLLIMFVIFMVLTLVVTYAFFIINERKDDADVRLFGNIYHGKEVFNKLVMVSAVGLVCILVITFYMQSIFSLSRQSMSNNQRVQEVESTLNAYTEERKTLTEEYNERYLKKAQIAAYIIDSKPELARREALAELSEILSLESVNVFDSEGVQIATNSPYTVFRLERDPSAQSYEFWKLLQGVDSHVQEARVDDVSGDFHQYIGVTMRDEDAIPTGFVQISVIPSRLEKTVDQMKIENVLKNIKVGNKGIVFAINKADGTFAYHPTKKLIERSAESYGITSDQLVDGYAGYLTVNSKKYYASSLETEDYYVYAAVPDSVLGRNRFPLALAATFATLIALAIMIAMLTLYRKRPGENAHAKAEEKHDWNSENIDVEMPDGRVTHTTTAASRWQLKFVGWKKKTAEQKFFAVLRILLGIFAVIICFVALFGEQLLDPSSVFLFVLHGTWARGVNIFALTGSVMVICMITVIEMIIQKILSIMARSLGAKAETICRLLKSLVKYIAVIAMLYYCLAMIGVDTTTLLASAGILTMIVGLGAQTLVADILAGLFIIFEGEFQVGDIVTIGDWRGTVIEIGVRTTKIQDGSMNIKVISNSSVSGVINMTRDYSFCSVDVGIEYGESLERVENVLEKEFPNIKAHLPAIIDGPFYKGVVALADNSVNIRIVVLCAEGDRIQMERDLNREMKLIFDKHDINVPFPQIVLNQPTEFKKATEWEKMKARKFNETQRELSSNLNIEEDNEER